MATRYFKWLIGKSGISSRYSVLLRYLYEKEYTWSVPMDANRAEDGKNLRLSFMAETKERLDVSELARPCSVLEMMVALATRIEIDILGVPGDIHPEKWIMDMIANASLSDMVNEGFDFRYVDGCLRKGCSVMFPSKLNNGRNSNNVQLWNLMSEHLNEVIEREGGY